MRNKILIFADYFLPGFKAGGPITTITNIMYSLSEEFDFDIITRNYDLGEKGDPYSEYLVNKWYNQKYYNIKFVTDKLISRQNIFQMIQGNWDLIYLNSFFSRFTVNILKLATRDKEIKNKILIAPRGELHTNALKYNGLKKVYI